MYKSFSMELAGRTLTVDVNRVAKQAKLLNLIMEQDWFNLNNQEIQKRLKEFVGHTPLQVAAGAALGIILAFVVHQSYL